MYISPCASHYYRERFERKSKEQLEEQRKILVEALLGLEEERAELEAVPGAGGARLRVQLERDAQMMRAKLSAIEGLLVENYAIADEA